VERRNEGQGAELILRGAARFKIDEKSSRASKKAVELIFSSQNKRGRGENEKQGARAELTLGGAVQIHPERLVSLRLIT
jgi:hypothetical protein